MIEFLNISKCFGPTKIAADNINLKVDDGEIFGFLGPNGAGKTTAIRMMTGILKPDSGQLKINDIDVIKFPLESKKQFGYVPDNPDLFLRLKGIEYLNFMSDIYDVPSNVRGEQINRLGSMYEMQGSLNDLIQSYSHGMRQKIVIMGALLHDPSIWILDEPMTGLDPKSSFTLKQMMRKHADSGNTVFFSTHVLEVAEAICDRVAIINKGKVLFTGSIQELKVHFKASESLENIFLEITENE